MMMVVVVPPGLLQLGERLLGRGQVAGLERLGKSLERVLAAGRGG